MVSFKKSFIGLAAVTALAGSSFAVPYASSIRVGTTSINAGSGTDIKYVLVESADSVTIDIVDSVTSAAVATFAGTTTRGNNTVAWNGTADNGAGLAIPIGSYRVKITANKVNSAYAEIASNSSSPKYGPQGTVFSTLYDGFSPNDFLSVRNTNSDFFGTNLANVCYKGATPAVAAIVLKSDLSTADGANGYDSRVLREPELEAAASIASSGVWGACLDPDSANIVYYTGQSGKAFWWGDLTSSGTLNDADPSDFLGLLLPRAVVVTREGANKYAYFAVGNEIRKGPIDPVTNQLSAATVPITTFTVARYARGIDVDAAGNIYFVSKQVTAGANGVLLRWDAATVAGPTPALTEANASWNIAPATGMLNMSGPAVSRADGNVYVGFATGTTVNAANGAYLVGNTSTAAIAKTLAPSDRVVDTTNTGTPPIAWNIGTTYYNLRCDPAGNLVLMDRSQEQIRMFTPGGTTSKAIVAPTSQTMTVLPSSVNDWSMY